MHSYTLADFLAMKPGTIINGLVNKALGTGWGKNESEICYAITESKAQIMKSLRPYSKKISNSILIRPPFECMGNLWQRNNLCKIYFERTRPLGMYLGHVLRINDIILVHILLFSESNDTVWL